MPSWLQSFDEKCIDFLIRDPSCGMSYFSLDISEFSLSFSFGSLIIMCLCVSLFEFIVFRICWTFWMFTLMSFTDLICFLPLFFQIISLSLLPQCICWFDWWCFTGPLDYVLFSFFKIFFFASISSVDLKKNQKSQLFNQHNYSIWDYQRNCNLEQAIYGKPKNRREGLAFLWKTEKVGRSCFKEFRVVMVLIGWLWQFFVGWVVTKSPNLKAAI